MSLYPTLEDMVVDQYQTIQRRHENGEGATSSFAEPSAPNYESRYSTYCGNAPPVYESIGGEFGAVREQSAYPTLPPYFHTQGEAGSHSSKSAVITQTNCLEQQRASGQTVLMSTTMIAPLTSLSDGLLKANVTHGIRQVVLAKDLNGKYGMRFRSFNKGVFVQFVADGSPAAAAGVRFGDQVLSIDNTEVVGMEADKAMDLLSKASNPYQLVINFRDRPFERTITLHKDSNGNCGFTHKENLITAIMKESSASRNGLLVNHRILEIDGRNVMAYKTKQVKACLADSPKTVTLTVMPNEIYDEMIKKMDWSLLKKQDHSIPDSLH